MNKLTFLSKAVEEDEELYADGFADVLGFDIKFELPVVSQLPYCPHVHLPVDHCSKFDTGPAGRRLVTLGSVQSCAKTALTRL